MADIIYARATGEGPAAIAVIRLSGAGAHALLAHLGVDPPALRRASLRRLRDPDSGDEIDHALVTLYAEGASYTGEESAELHIHGGAATAEAVFAALERAGARLAQPGEFTRRAVQSGAMDMAEAEGVGALIAAETEGQRRQALRALNGEIGVLARRWRTRIIAALGLAETSIDFVEEQLGDGLLAQAAAELESLILEMSSHVDDASAVAHAPDRPTVALIGPPNVGKSSFLNALLGSERAITSAEPGTTRDTIEIRLLVEGREVIVVDTAGIRHARTDIEEEGVARTWRVAESADLRVFLISADTKTAFRDAGLAPDAADGLFWTKADLAEPSEAVCGDHGAFSATVSIVDPAALRTAFARFVKAKLPSAAAPLSPLAGAARRIAITERARSAAREAVASLHEGHPELGIAKMHEVGRHLEALTGVVGQEDVLDALFSRFCIGK